MGALVNNNRRRPLLIGATGKSSQFDELRETVKRGINTGGFRELRIYSQFWPD
jgi:hypothetical protein